MLELEDECKKAGITVMNEIGLDPVCFQEYRFG
jgi:saccharopine dehydrogenase-like NADP-dependent oxidoreductase